MAAKIDVFQLHQNLYPKNDLGSLETRFLEENDYKRVRSQDLTGKAQFYYLKSTPPNQSDQHYFLVELVALELENHFGNVQISHTVQADIEFTHNRQKFALEIETNHDIEKDKEKLLVKSSLLEGNYGQNWWFIVTDNHSKEFYQKYGKTMARTEIPAWILEIKKNPQSKE